MEYDDCKPGISIYHDNGFYGIISGKTKQSKFDCDNTLFEIIKIDGEQYWAYPEFMTKYKRGL